jgi:hypothetical protein
MGSGARAASRAINAAAARPATKRPATATAIETIYAATQKAPAFETNRYQKGLSRIEIVSSITSLDRHAMLSLWYAL